MTPVQSASPLAHEHEKELTQLREANASLTAQCAQLDQANQAWLQYQQTQLDTFRNTFQNYLPIDDVSSLDQAAQQVLDQINKEKEDFTRRYHDLEQLNDELRHGKS